MDSLKSDNFDSRNRQIQFLLNVKKFFSPKNWKSFGKKKYFKLSSPQMLFWIEIQDIFDDYLFTAILFSFKLFCFVVIEHFLSYA